MEYKLTLNRRKLIIQGTAFGSTISLIPLISSNPALAGDGGMFDMEKLMKLPALRDHFLGNENAKAIMIEYASSTCPYCAAFHVNTYPKIKETYIDSGKLRFVLRPFVLNVLDAVVFMLAFKAGEEGVENYYAILDSYLKTQSQWAQAKNPKQAIFKIAQQHGFTEESFEAVLTNQELFEGIEAIRKQASKEFDMHGTPSFYLNGKKLSGNYSFEEMAKEIDLLLD